MAANTLSRSDNGGTEPAGEDVRGGVNTEGLTDTGVEGCSGALAVALLLSNLESWDAFSDAGREGDSSGVWTLLVGCCSL